MSNIKMIRVFFSTALFFLCGFCLIFILRNLVGSRNWFYYMLIQLITMILSGVVMFFIFNWKYLKKNRKVMYVKEKKIFYIKCRVYFSVFLMIPAIYYCSFGYRAINIPLFMGKINDLLFHMEYKTFVLNFHLVSSDLFTVLSILVFILTYIVLEVLFVNIQSRNSES